MRSKNQPTKQLASLISLVIVLSLSACSDNLDSAIATSVSQTLQVSQLETAVAQESPSDVCPSANSNVSLFRNDQYGFCFLYPSDHRENEESEFALSISGPPPPENTDAFTTLISIQIIETGEKGSDQFAQDMIGQLEEGSVTEGTTPFNLGLDKGVWASQIFFGLGPQDGRLGYIVHNGNGYVLMMIPDGGTDYDISILADTLWETVTNSWVWFTP